MSGQQQQKGGGGQAAKTGVTFNHTIAPENLSDKKSLSDMFVFGGGACLLAIGCKYIVAPVARALFGVDAKNPASSTSLGTANLKQLIDGAIDKAPSDSNKQWIAKEAFGAMSDESKAKMAEWAKEQVTKK